MGWIMALDIYLRVAWRRCARWVGATRRDDQLSRGAVALDAPTFVKWLMLATTAVVFPAATEGTMAVAVERLMWDVRYSEKVMTPGVVLRRGFLRWGMGWNSGRVFDEATSKLVENHLRALYVGRG